MNNHMYVIGWFGRFLELLLEFLKIQKTEEKRRKGKERKGKERKGKERMQRQASCLVCLDNLVLCRTDIIPVIYFPSNSSSRRILNWMYDSAQWS